MKKLIAVLLCVTMLFSFAAFTASAAEAEEPTTRGDSSRNDDGLIVPANWTQFLMALFVRLFEIISGWFQS